MSFKNAWTEAENELADMRKPKSAHGGGWNPYSFEGGSCAAIAGSNFAILAGDTRMSQFEVSPLSRDTDKVHVLSENVALTSAGFYGDVLQLRRLLHSRMAKYAFDYRTPMSVDLCSEMLARNLYYNRFFPLYTGVVLAGIAEDGTGGVYSYDPIGCIERLPYSVSGTALAIIEPFLDAQIGWMTQDKKVEPVPELTLNRAMSIMKDAFRVAAERDSGTGDQIQMVIMKAGAKPSVVYVQLRED